MDSIVKAIKDRQKELQAELKRLDATLVTYQPTEPVVSTYVLTDEDKDSIGNYVRLNAPKTGIRALEVRRALELPGEPILAYMRKSPKFKQVNVGKRNQRFIFFSPKDKADDVMAMTEVVKTTMKTAAKPSVGRGGGQAGRKRGPYKKTAARVTSKREGLHHSQVAYNEAHAKVREFLVSHRLVTTKMLLQKLGINTTSGKKHLEDFVNAECAKDLGFDQRLATRDDKGRPVGRAPRTWESLIYRAPNLGTTTGVPGAGIYGRGERRP